MTSLYNTLRERKLVRNPDTHEYTLGNIEMDSIFGLNKTDYLVPTDELMIEFGCINYLFSIFGLVLTGATSSKDGYLATYEYQNGAHFGTFSISNKVKSKRFIYAAVLKEFSKLISNKRGSLYTAMGELCPYFPIDKVTVGLDEFTRLRNESADAAKGIVDIKRVRDALKARNKSLLDRCIKINSVVDHSTEFSKSGLDSYKNVDSSNCTNNHRIIARIICGDDEELARALEDYIKVKESLSTRNKSTRTMDLIVPLSKYDQTQLGHEKQVRFIIATSIFDAIYDDIIANYYRYHGEQNESPTDRDILNKSDLTSTAREYLKILHKVIPRSENAKSLLDFDSNSPLLEAELTKIRNICIMDYSMPIVLDLMGAIYDCSKPEEFKKPISLIDKNDHQKNIKG